WRRALRPGLAVLLLRVPPLGLAPSVLHRRPAGAAGVVRARPGEGIRRVARNAPGDVARAGPRHRVELEAVPVPGPADGHDEPGVARDPGHVPNLPAARLGLLSDQAGGTHRVFDGRGAERRGRVLPLLRSPGAAPA